MSNARPSNTTPPKVVIITSVDAEAEAIGMIAKTEVIVSGVGRTNAAIATTEAILRNSEVGYIINAGVAGALPGSGLEVGDCVAASSCIYFEEGIITPSGFQTTEEMGFPLDQFFGNAVPPESMLVQIASREFGWQWGPIATVATCSGTDAAAKEVVTRTGAIAEAMEGAAVVHAARRFGKPAIELRVISNTTGNRDKQMWNLKRALNVLGERVGEFAASFTI